MESVHIEFNLSFASDFSGTRSSLQVGRDHCMDKNNMALYTFIYNMVLSMHFSFIAFHIKQ